MRILLLPAMLLVCLCCPLLAFSQDAKQFYEPEDTLAAAVVTALENRSASTQTGLERLDKSRISNGFALLSTPDVLKVIQALPGVASGTELMSGLYVHGGDGSDNLFLLDGVPMYQVSHLAGLFSSFNADVLDRVDFYKSGFPGRYGGRLSSVVDVRTSDGDFYDWSGVFSIGLIDGRLQFDGPIVRDKLSFNVALRRSWLDVLSVPGFAIANRGKLEQKDAGYSFTDANASLAWKVSDGNKLTARFYLGDDALRLMESATIKEYGTDRVYSGTDETSGRIRWGNILGSLAWDGSVSENLGYNVTAYYSRSMSRVKFGVSDWSLTDADEELINSVTETNRSLTEDIGIKADVIYIPHRNHHLRLGMKCNMLVFRPEHLRLMESAGNMSESGNAVRYVAGEASVYVEDEMKLAGWLDANLGVRYAPNFVRGKTWHHIEPRVALRFRCCDDVSIKASYSEMNQFAHRIATTYLDLPTNCWMPSTEKVAPMHSRQFAAGVYSQLPYDLVFNVEGFYKTMDNLLEYVGSNSLFPPLDKWETDFAEGIGRAYGMEVELGYRTLSTDVSLYYTLSWSQRHFAALYHDWFPDRNDNRHKITIQARHKFSDKFDLYAAWNYHSGGYMTGATYEVAGESFPQDFYNRPNNIHIPDYHRLDVGMNFRKRTKRGNLRTWNISIYNLYCRMNAINAAIEKGDDGRYHGVAHGLVPIIPSFSYTLEF